MKIGLMQDAAYATRLRPAKDIERATVIAAQDIDRFPFDQLDDRPLETPFAASLSPPRGAIAQTRYRNFQPR
jgi:hypothetical protein